MDAVIFDLDGTLLDSKGTIFRCINAALGKFGYDTFRPEELYGLIGMDLAKILDLKGANTPELRTHYTELQLGTYRKDMSKYDGVDGLLSTVRERGFNTGLVTMRRTEISHKIMEGFGIREYFDVILGVDSVEEAKPSPGHVLDACRKLGVQPSDSVLVGDSKFDMLAGSGAGCLCVGVTWGMGTVGDLRDNGANWLVDSLEELKALLSGLREG